MQDLGTQMQRLQPGAMESMTYSDFGEMAKRYNVATPDFFADMAKAFLLDKDAVDGKVARYYRCIVKK